MDEFHGVPLTELRIKSIDWRHRAKYIRTRTNRKVRPRELDIEPAWRRKRRRIHARS